MSCPFGLVAFFGLCQSEDVLSAVNFARGDVKSACALEAVSALEGMDLVSREEEARRSRALFAIGGGAEELLLNIRRPEEGSANVYLSITPEDPDDPLRHRALEAALKAADEAIYVNCTEDGRAWGSSVIIESQKD